jgi:hypothetical protein
MIIFAVLVLIMTTQYRRIRSGRNTVHSARRPRWHVNGGKIPVNKRGLSCPLRRAAVSE